MKKWLLVLIVSLACASPVFAVEQCSTVFFKAGQIHGKWHMEYGGKRFVSTLKSTCFDPQSQRVYTIDVVIASAVKDGELCIAYRGFINGIEVPPKTKCRPFDKW